MTFTERLVLGLVMAGSAVGLGLGLGLAMSKQFPKEGPFFPGWFNWLMTIPLSVAVVSGILTGRPWWRWGFYVVALFLAVGQIVLSWRWRRSARGGE